MELGPGELRVFVAVPLDDTARAAVHDLLDRLADDPRTAEAGRLRWAVTENVHLTLRFLGATPRERVPDVAAAAEAAAHRVARFRARIGGAGAFPSPARPRVVWLGITAGAAELSRLAGALGDELAARGWERDERPFRAHLTLARADGVPGAARAVDALAAAAAGLDVSWRVDRLVVFHSELGRGPARYRPLATSELRDGSLPSQGDLR